MFLFFLTFTVTLVFSLLIPDHAYAWGPATHIYLGVEILKDVSVLSPAVAAILTKFPYDFLYGCISADITVGKKYIQYHKHCHNWNIGFKILAEAQSTAQKAFAFGYLTHLAADTVAHNFFVPGHMISSYSTKSLGHTYWEIRADSLIRRKYWHEFEKIDKEVQKTHDRLIRTIVERTIFPFDVNKGIFNSIMMINRLKQWRQIVRGLTSFSQWDLGLEDIKKYHRLSTLLILDLLISFEHAECLKLDPTGKANIRSAMKIKKSLKRLALGSRLNDSTYQSVVRQLPVQYPFFE